MAILAALALRPGEARIVASEPFVAWAKKHAVPIKTVEAGQGFDDLQPLKRIIGEARLVGVGEATHGTREFFQFKHRMFEFLVQEMGFTAFAMETDFARAIKLNDYVLGGAGDAVALVRGMGYWIWNTEEVVALVEWIRQHNLKATTARKVKFYGFDMQSPSVPLIEALNYLKTVDPERAREFEPLASKVAPLHVKRDAQKPARDEAKVAIERLVRCLESNRARFVQASSDDAWSLALQLARVSLQGIVHYNDGTNATRDAAMAKNVQWIAEREGPVGRVMLWAHNGHILHLTSPLQDWFRWDAVLMGRLLRMKFGRDYVAFGLAFDRGEVRNLQRKISTVGPTDPESLDGVLARVGLPIFALELPGRIDDVGAESWLKVKHATHMFGLNQNANGTEELPIRDCYEAMIFFAKTTAAHANPGLD